MNVIALLSKNYDSYVKKCLDVLEIPVNIIQVDYTKGETDFVHLLSIEKKGFTTSHAIAILTMRLLLWQEEWNDFHTYEKEDIERWIGFLKKQYENCEYVENVEIKEFKNNFFLSRLKKENEIKTIKRNAKTIDFQDFKQQNQLFFEKIIHVSKTNFNRLEEEFYIETTHHFVLFNWFTTA